MAEFILGAIFLAGVGALGVGAWMWASNDQTYVDRSWLIEQRHRETDLGRARALDQEFDRVGYRDHHWALVGCRDPWKLYGPVTQALAASRYSDKVRARGEVRLTDALSRMADRHKSLTPTPLTVYFSSMMARDQFVSDIERDLGMRGGGLGRTPPQYDGIAFIVKGLD